MKRFTDWPRRAAPLIERKGGDYIRLRFKRNFEAEGFPEKWRPLAPRTVEQRRKLGFAGEHPILQRTRALKRSVVEQAHPYNLTKVEVKPRKGTVTLTLGSTDPRFGLLHGGGTTPTGGVVPARPMVVLGEADLPGLDNALAFVIDQALQFR
jgi:hypothetical protein